MARAKARYRYRIGATSGGNSSVLRVAVVLADCECHQLRTNSGDCRFRSPRHCKQRVGTHSDDAGIHRRGHIVY